MNKFVSGLLDFLCDMEFYEIKNRDCGSFPGSVCINTRIGDFNFENKMRIFHGRDKILLWSDKNKPSTSRETEMWEKMSGWEYIPKHNIAIFNRIIFDSSDMKKMYDLSGLSLDNLNSMTQVVFKKIDDRNKLPEGPNGTLLCGHIKMDVSLFGCFGGKNVMVMDYRSYSNYKSRMERIMSCGCSDKHLKEAMKLYKIGKINEE